MSAKSHAKIDAEGSEVNAKSHAATDAEGSKVSKVNAKSHATTDAEGSAGSEPLRATTPSGVGSSPSYWVATWFGLGLSKFAPGTMGALGALPLFFALRPLGALPLFSTALALTVAGVWSAQRVATRLGADDPQLVVIDEVAGVFIALSFVASGPLWLQALAFVAFRVLDIVKPGPIAALERLRPKGIGIMADDVAAGLLAGALCRLALFYL